MRIPFDGYSAPSFLQSGSERCGVEFFSLTKSYSMAGWRVGFAFGNREIVGALIKIRATSIMACSSLSRLRASSAERTQDCVEI